MVITLGTTYMAHEAVLGRIAKALDPVQLRILICTGDDLPPEQISVPDGMEVRAYVPHAAVLPGAALVVTHAGTGTLLSCSRQACRSYVSRSAGISRRMRDA